MYDPATRLYIKWQTSYQSFTVIQKRRLWLLKTKNDSTLGIQHVDMSYGVNKWMPLPFDANGILFLVSSGMKIRNINIS